MLITYPAPDGSPLAQGITAQVDGRPLAIYRCQAVDFAVLCADHPVEVVVECDQPIDGLVIRPLHHGVQAVITARRASIMVDRPRTVYLEFPGRPPLVLTIDPLETWKPGDDPQEAIVFGPGVHHAGEIAIGSGQTLYLAGGAWVHGRVHAIGAHQPAIRGRGVLDGSLQGHHRLIVFEGCTDVLVEGITTVATQSWNLVFGACDRVHATRLKLIGWVVTSDGIDVVGSRDVLIEHCFLRNNDDCIALKAVDYETRTEPAPYNWCRDVERVLVRRCVCYNDQAGNVFEIGFETRTSAIREVTFENIDVIGAHGHGGVFTIHNGDRAVISDILYKDIRVEHFYDLLVDFRVLHSRYSRDTERGRIQRVRLSGIRTIEDQYNTPSLIGGFDAAHPVEDVVFEDVRIGERLIRDADQLHLFTRHVQGLVFR